VTPEDIKALRKELACTAKELAGALDLDQATVLAWERGEKFPTKQYVDRMNALRSGGPGAVPRKSAKGAKEATPMKVLADPALWGLVRKIVAHKALRDAVMRLAADYSDPAED
jgi:transcriptional regulator with XRE-family HTH domain